MHTKITPSLGQLSEVLAATTTVAAKIEELGSVNIGILYAHLANKIQLGTYISVVSILRRNGVVNEADNVLTWVGATTHSMK